VSPDPPDPLIEIVSVTAGYSGIVAIRDIDLAVSAGQVLGLLGPNGAGKSTLLKVMSGQLEPMRGHVHVGDVHINGASSADLARVGICSIPEGRGIFPNLSVRDNLRVFSHAAASDADIEAATYARFPRLGERRNQLAGTMSGGEQQMLALSRGLATDPAILLIDELSMGLAPLIVAELYDIVAEVASTGVTVVVVEQFATLVLPIADTVAVMNSGTIRWTGPPAEADQVLAESYLGKADPVTDAETQVFPAPSHDRPGPDQRRRRTTPLRATS
jgi:branched-chain amino acid transport system ATP-binding protein